MSDQGEPSESAADEPAARHLDPTGVPHLDEVLGGGVQRGSLVLVVGSPGSGKTTLAAQMAFAAARAGRRVVILTALSEPSTKLIAHLRTYSFFDEQLVGDTIQVLALGSFLAADLPAAVDGVVAEVRQRRVSLVVLDSFSSVRGTVASPQETGAFLSDLGARLGMLGATTLITSDAVPRERGHFPEMTHADALLGLHYSLEGVRVRRAIETIKVRGSPPLLGLHSFGLTADGITVYPRLEARTILAWNAAEGAGSEGPGASPSELAERMAFDLPALDTLLDGGLNARTSTLILGSIGVGKTLLSLHFALAGVRIGQPAVFLGFHETREELLYKAASFTLDSQLRAALAADGGLTLLRQPSVECDADMLADRLLAEVDRTDARRVVIDSVAELERAIAETSDARRIPNYLAALLEGLRLRGVTTLLVRETGVLAAATPSQPADMISLLAANVIWMQQVAYQDRLYRVLSAPKMRFSAHDVALREFRIAAPHGLQVLAPIESNVTVLAGIAHQHGQPTTSGDQPSASL